MSSPLRIAVIGCGKIADAHVAAILRTPGCNLVGVCDSEPLMAEQLALRFGLNGVFDNANRLIEQVQPDIVHITTPPQSHVSLACRAFEAGCHVLMEKPIALNARLAAEILNASRGSGKLLAINYLYLLDAAAIRLRELVARGHLGSILHIESLYGYDLAGPFGSAALQDENHWVHDLPGRLLQNVIDHLINKIAELLPPDEPDRIHATGLRISKAARADSSGMFFDELRVLLQSGQVTAYATFSSHLRPMEHVLRVHGSKGSATLDLNTSTLRLHRVPTFPSVLGRLLPPFQEAYAHLGNGIRNIRRFVESDFHFYYGLNTLLQRFYESVRLNADPPIPYDRILRVASITDSIFAQLREQSENTHHGRGRIPWPEPSSAPVAK